MISRRNFIAATAGSGMILSGKRAIAQEWPARPVRLILPFAAGSGTDALTRLLVAELEPILDATFVVENRPGMGGSVGAGVAARAEPDGYTILVATPGAQMTNPFLTQKLPYDAEKDFAPIVHLLRSPNILVVNTSLPVKNLKEFIAYAKAHPGKLSYGSTGIGSTGHLGCELLKSMTGIDMVHVPYKSSGEVVLEIMAGRVQVGNESVVTTTSLVKEGKLTPLGVSTVHRLPEVSDIPAVAEVLPGFEASAQMYLTAPAGTPRNVIDKLNEASNKALKAPKIVERFRQLGITATGGSPEDLAQIVTDERKKWKAVIEASGASLDK